MILPRTLVAIGALLGIDIMFFDIGGLMPLTDPGIATDFFFSPIYNSA